MTNRIRAEIDRIAEEIGMSGTVGDDPWRIAKEAKLDALYDSLAQAKRGPGHPTEIVAQSRED